MAEKTYEQWLSGQPHKRTDKITNIQRATSRFLPPAGVTTWGEWYDSEGITPDFEKPKKPAPTKAETDTTRALKPKITMTKVRIENNSNALYGVEPGSPEYKELLALINRDKAELKDLNARLKAAQDKENKPKVEKENAKTQADFENKLKTWEEELKAAQDDVQRAKDTDGDVEAARDEVDRVKNKKPTAPTPKPVPGVTPPPVAPTPTPKKPVAGATANDTDGDGIPNNIDADPNTPAPKATPTPTPTTPSSTTTKDGTVIPAGQDDKTVWVSYLKATFKGLEDPEMKKQIDTLITRANKFNMDEEQFMLELQGTKWWQNTYPSLRTFFIESNDPRNKANFAEKVQENTELVTRKLESLGVRINDIDPTTGKIIDNTELIRGIALQTIENGWKDNDLNDYLASRADVLFTGGGTIGSSFENIKRQASLYGVSIDKTFEKEINLSLLDSSDLRDANYWLTEMKQQAYDNPMYKAFAPAMKDNNRTLYEVTNSYRKQMADLLEVDASTISWKDLMDKTVDGTTGNARTFADFTKALKKDPMWQYTKNAKETYSGMALDIAKMFGFVG
jgi:hypothetical protein